MKIRNGFVSNSSTTSFCVYGFCYDDVDFNELIQSLDLETIKDAWKERYAKNDYLKRKHSTEENFILSQLGKLESFKEQEEFNGYAFSDLLYLIGIEDVKSGYDADMVYIGKEFREMKDDETKNEFRSRITSEIEKTSKYLTEKGDFGIWEEAFYDG